ncbi:MAG: alpha-1,4-polygalactosaminidase [Rhodospirillaceae bacterium]|nr:alpha-1,4-polygalactosaminidase [Rhodospirillaceae bacterium]
MIRRILTTLLATTCLFSLAAATAQEKPVPPAPAVGRALGPPAGSGLEGSDPEPEERVEEAPAIPVPAANAKPSTSSTDLLDRTRSLLGEIEVLDIPLQEIPNYRAYMRETIEDLAVYAEKRDPNFIVVTRPGFDLLSWSRREFDLAEIKRDPFANIPQDSIVQVGTPMRRYIQSIDGFLLNGQFCAPLRVPAADLQVMLKQGLKALSIEHCRTPDQASAALQTAVRMGVVSHIDLDDTDDFARTPTRRPSPENPRNVETLLGARNMVMLLDSRDYETRGEWFAAMAGTNYDILVTDAFYKGNRSLTKDEVHHLKFKEMGARRLVLARMSVGYAEDERFYWQRDWRIGEPSWIQALGPERAGQYVVEFWNPAWKAIVGRYFAGIMDLGFDGVVLDGVEAYRRWEFMTPLDPVSATRRNDALR